MALTFENVCQGPQDQAQSEDGRRHAAGAGGAGEGTHANVLLMCCQCVADVLLTTIANVLPMCCYVLPMCCYVLLCVAMCC